MSRHKTASTIAIRLTGIISQDARLRTSHETVTLPADRIAPGELVFRLEQEIDGLLAGDLLIVEPRQDAATGEVVIATLDDRAFVGRWWTKHGTRMLLDNEFRTIADSSDLVVLGAVTLIAWG